MAANFPLNPHFREYLYHILYSMPPEDKFVLKGKYYRIGRTNFYAKRFCDTAKIEEIFYVLSLLGLDWFLVIYNKKDEHVSVSNVLEKEQDGNSNSYLRNIAKRQLYVAGSKIFMQNLATASQTIHTTVFRQHLELEKAGYHARGWSKKLGTKKVTEALVNHERLNYFVETILNSAVSCKRGDMSENEMLILLYFYRHGSNYITGEQVTDKFCGLMHTKKILSARKKLILSNRIQKHPKERTYTITALGVAEINKLINNILKENSF